MKKFAAWVTAAVLLSTTYSGLSYGSSINDMRNQQNTIKNNRLDTEAKLKEAQMRKSAALAEVEAVDQKLADATDQLLYFMDELDRTTILLADTEVELEIAQKDREDQYEVMKKRLRFMYENGKTSYLHALFNVDSFGDFLNRVDYINRIVDYDNNMVANLQAVEDLIAEKVESIEIHKIEIEVLARNQEKVKQDLEVQLAEKERLVNAIEADEKKYTQQIADLDNSSKQIEAMIKAEQAKQAAAARSASTSVSTSAAAFNGRVAWPVPAAGGISSPYGYRTNPISKKREFHTGIDIPAPTGTNIVASDDGVVISAGNVFSGYGLSLLVDHGNGMSTFYAHCSRLIASKGQTVKKGEVIAKVGSTGYSTGPHLHYEVRINGAHQDPEKYAK